MLTQEERYVLRFLPKVEKTESCWNFRPGKGRYGFFHNGTTTVLAHRWAWEYEHGPIPDGMTIDHLCLNKKCVRTLHMELVTRGENARRYMLALTHCANGHEFTPENTYHHKAPTTGGTQRVCRTCHKRKTAMQRQTQREVMAYPV